MAKSYQAPSSKKQPNQRSAPDYPLADRNLAGMQPEKAQEAIKPTEGEPVRMHARMAGCT